MHTLLTTLPPTPLGDAFVRALVGLMKPEAMSDVTFLYAVDEMDEALRLQLALAESGSDLSVEMVGLPVSSQASRLELVEAVRRSVQGRTGEEAAIAVVPTLSSTAAGLWWVAHELEQLGGLWVGAVRGESVCFDRVERDDGTVREPRAAYTTGPARDQEGPQQVADRLGFLGTSTAVQQALEDAGRLAGHQVPILVRGETGTGKGVMARLIHELSAVRDGPFVAVNCAALPETLVESILFGHSKGAFTGATRDQAGKFEQADGGTLFLDELGELPPALQPKLLKVLDDGVVERLGSDKTIQVDVRLIAATNVDLEEAVEQGGFRQDLYYRVSYGLLHLPPLRERTDDIELLASGLLAGINRQLAEPKRLAADAVDWLASQEWPGNVRDLQNVLGRAALLSGGDVIQAEDLARYAARSPDKSGTGAPTPHVGFSLEKHLAGVRADLMEKALSLAHGNQSLAARMLGISPQAVHKYVKGQGAAEA